MRTLALLFAVSAAAFAQCTLDGTVVNSANGAPIERAHIAITGAGDTLFADSDATGKWTVERLPCQGATLTVNRPGFLKKQQFIPKSTNDIQLKLVPQAVLAGRVVDEDGDPIPGAQISLMTHRVINGLRGTQASTSEVTNDLGEYRFSDLEPGKYSLCANPGAGAISASNARPYSEKCYPGSTPMDVAAGYEDRIDFVLTPDSTVRVGGKVSGQFDTGTAMVTLVPRTQIGRMNMGLASAVKPDGAFVIRRVPPSSYTAYVRSGEMQTHAAVEVGSADIDSLQLHFDPGSPVTAIVKTVSTGAEKRQATLSAILTSADGFSATGVNWAADAPSFTFPAVQPGNYRLEITPPAGFYVKSITLGGRDISNSDFVVAPGMANIEVVFADDGGVVEGDISEPAWVLLQKDGVASRNTRTDANGHFKIDNVPPDEYKVYAWDDNTNVEYANPEWMRQNAKGVDVSVAPGQAAHVSVTRQTEPPI